MDQGWRPALEVFGLSRDRAVFYDTREQAPFAEGATAVENNVLALFSRAVCYPDARVADLP